MVKYSYGGVIIMIKKIIRLIKKDDPKIKDRIKNLKEQFKEEEKKEKNK
jgi:hypothetical protein